MAFVLSKVESTGGDGETVSGVLSWSYNMHII